LFGSKPAPQTQVAWIDSAKRERRADSAITGSPAAAKAKPAPQIEIIAAANPKSSDPGKNDSVGDEAPKNYAPKSKPQQTATVQLKPTPQQEANVAPTLSDNVASTSRRGLADSFNSRWGGLQ